MELSVARPVLAPPDPLTERPAAPSTAGGGERAGGGWGPPGWAPPLPAITYVKEAATTLLLVLALPYVIYRLLTAPGDLLSAVGRRHVKP